MRKQVFKSNLENKTRHSFTECTKSSKNYLNLTVTLIPGFILRLIIQSPEMFDVFKNTDLRILEIG